MQRRDLLKLLVPAALLPVAAYAGLRFWPGPASCSSPGEATLLAWLKPLADPELGRLASVEPPSQWWKAFEGACASNFVARFRQQVAADFAAGRVVRVDGWVLSETEAFTHRAVYRASVSRAGAIAP